MSMATEVMILMLQSFKCKLALSDLCRKRSKIPRVTFTVEICATESRHTKGSTKTSCTIGDGNSYNLI